MKLLVKNAQILPMTEDRTPQDPWFYGDMAVEDGTIVAVGQVPEDFRPDRVLDGQNRALLPGFVNSHTHTAMVLLRGFADDMPLMDWLENKIWPAENRLTRDMVYAGTLLGMAEMIRCGTTSFLDMYFHQDQVARAALQTGLRTVLSRGLIGFEPDFSEKLADNVELKNRWAGQGEDRITVMLGPHAPYTCMPEHLDQVMEMAHKHDMGIHIHVSETAGEVRDAMEKWGKSPVRHLYDLGVFDRPTVAAHCVHVDGEDMELMLEKGVSVAHNPSSNLKLASGFAPTAAMMEKGINVSLGTDGASSNNNLNIVEEMHLASLIPKAFLGDATAMPAYEALKMATVNGAKALGLSGVGCLKPGNRADFILVDLNRPHLIPGYNLVSDLVYSAQSTDVVTTVVNGRILMEDGEIKTMDLPAVMQEVRGFRKILEA